MNNAQKFDTLRADLIEIILQECFGRSTYARTVEIATGEVPEVSTTAQRQAEEDLRTAEQILHRMDSRGAINWRG